ncbi:ATP-binding cassette domain-containing protein [Ferruginivarius sediminum]|uniref:ATP-binding protein Uup n=1 Tax=Ferruginivarius sediminum TaxID=2661937 RepID=A0A369T7G4_9PROT|nr:ATP-binding cassette domain-containing protein [Ferruginivarius sediminum]RDD61279.1 ATP-binding cassette domain-containing protein [Ferruginivarius sediminum]
MAPPPLIQLKDATLALGHQVLAEDVTMTLARGERACLVGRNGSGKSTLLRALAGEIDLDAGERFLQPGARVAYLPQQPHLPPEQTVADFVAGGLPESAADERHRVDAALVRLDVDGSRRLGTLSGGEGRRAALARTLVAECDVLLLDEPTNHLDLPTIEWLEGELKRFDGALLVISHDRAFLREVSRITFWLDRGTMRRMDRNYAHFDEWAEETAAEEERQFHKLTRRIKREEHWLTYGFTARRKRNQGRLRRLQDLRESRAKLLDARTGELNLTVAEAEGSGKTVIEAKDIAKGFTRDDGSTLRVVKDFSTRIRKGDRIGVIGPNGAGKTTLIRLLTKELEPDKGSVQHGTRLKPIYFDQRRQKLDPEKTLWETLCPGGGDSVMVGDRQRHVVTYLKEFLFSEGQARQPVHALSGGETNRLLLAKLFSQPSNLIILDEPTNDLDMDTLDLLIEVLGDYDGTLLLVSHDRDFLDKTVTSVVVMEGDGLVEEFPGGYSDSLSQRRGTAGPTRLGGKTKAEKKAKSAKAEKPRGRPEKLSYKEQRDLDELPEKIERLQAKIEQLQSQMSDPDFYRRDPGKFEEASEALKRAQEALDKAETRWLELEERRESIQAAGGRP